MFWLHAEDLPAGVGGRPFCAAHLAYLVFFLALAVCYAFFYKRLDAAHRRTADRVLSLLVCLFGLGECVVTVLIGRFSRYSLPLHVCSLMFFLAPVHAWTNVARPGSSDAGLGAFLGAVLFYPGFPGALAALLFPDWLYYPFWNYLSVSCFLAHGLLCVYGASMLISISQAPDPAALFLRDLKYSALFLSIGAPVMFLLDRAAGTNYWFMAGPSNDSPFVRAFERGGLPGYYLAFALTVLAVTALWYGLRYLLLVRWRAASRKSG